MIKLIGHHACRNTGNALHIEKSGLPAAISTFNPTNSKNPFLGSGYYFWDYNIRMAKYWGKSHYDNKYYIFQADIPYDENTLLDLVGNRQHIEWLVDLMDDFKDANEGNAHWNIGTFIEFLKEIAEEDEYSDIFSFKSIRAIDHSASIPNVEYYFDGQSKAYITLNPRIIICIIDANPLTLQNLKLIYQK